MNKRNSKLELLRIISIFFIVLSHYVVHSGLNIDNLPLGFNKIILDICILGNVGTMLLGLISGYFLINSNKVKIKKIIHFWLQVFFYSFFIYLLLLLFNKENFNIKSLFLNMFPITFKRYWFATTYFIMYLFHPYINKFINSMAKREHFYFIVLGTAIFYVMSTLTTMDYYGNELIYFLILYIIGAYLSKYKDIFIYKNNNCLKMLIASALLIFISIISFELIGLKIDFFKNHSTYFLNIYSILALLLSISLFVYFTKLKPNSNKIVNFISSLIFGVYLISDNKYLREIIWCDLFKNKDFFTSNYLVLHIFGSVLLVCIICLLIELIRKEIFEITLYNHFDSKVDKLEKNIDNKLKSIDLE